MIRAANLGDAPALAAFGRETFFDTFGHLYPQDDAELFSAQRYSLARTLEDLNEQGRYIQLAVVDEKLIGFLDCGPLGLPVENPATGGLEIYRLYVSSAAKGTGLAHELMEMALTWARGQAAPSLYLGVYCDNARAQAFYRKYGFEIIAHYKFKVGKTLDDERIMELKLS